MTIPRQFYDEAGFFLGDMPKAIVLYGQPNVITEQVLILPGFSGKMREKESTLQITDDVRY